MKKLIATDFDGTLYINHEITDYTRKEINRWRESGRYFGVVTGRGEDFFITVKELSLPIDFLILYNGAYIVNSRLETVYESFIEKSDFSETENHFSKISGIEEYSKTGESPRYHQFCVRFTKPERALEEAENYNRIYGDKLTAFVNGQHINIVKKGTSKTDGVKRILTYFGLKENEGAAVGDDYNDLDMLISLNGWAVKTAKPDILRQVNNVCESVGSLAESLLNE